MTEEELRLKLGLDTAELDSGSKRALDNISNFGRESHKSFIHGDSAAKGFKKTLHELSESIPAVGWALRGMASATGAAFAGIAAVIGIAVTKLDEWNAKLNETGAKNALPIGTPPDQWASFYRTRQAAADMPKTGQTPRQIEGNEHVLEARRKAAEMVGLRQKELDDAQADWKKADEAAHPGLLKDYSLDLLSYLPGIGEDVGDWRASKAQEVEDAQGRVIEARRKLQEARNRAGLLNGLQADPTEQPATPTPIGKGNLFNLFGIDAIRTMKLADLAKKGAFDTPKIQLDEAGGVAYKPLPGAPGYIPAGAVQTPNTNPGLTRIDLIVRSLQRIEQEGIPVYGKDQ